MKSIKGLQQQIIQKHIESFNKIMDTPLTLQIYGFKPI